VIVMMTGSPREAAWVRVQMRVPSSTGWMPEMGRQGIASPVLVPVPRSRSNIGVATEPVGNSKSMKPWSSVVRTGCLPLGMLRVGLKENLTMVSVPLLEDKEVMFVSAAASSGGLNGMMTEKLSRSVVPLVAYKSTSII